MPDPYATSAPDLSGRPSGPTPWEEPVRERGGALLGAGGEVPAGGAFLVVGCRGIGTLAPFARLDAALATVLWIEHAGEGASAEAANALFRALRESSAPVFALKHGSVAGPPDRPGRYEIPGEVVLAALDAALAGEVVWETDPDFGYEVPAEVPGLSAADSRALLPRLLYADHDRVYEHAGLVAAKKRERAGLLERLGGLDPAVSAATGWPPAPSPGDWKA